MSVVRLIRVVGGRVVGVVEDAPEGWASLGIFPQPEYREGEALIGEVELPDGGFGPAPEPVIEPVPTPALTADQIIAWAEGKLSEAIAENPPSERLSWDIQIAEANSILAGESVPTPLIDAQAQVTGELRVTLANKVLGKRQQLALYTGVVVGLRRTFMERIKTEALQLSDIEAAHNQALGGSQ